MPPTLRRVVFRRRVTQSESFLLPFNAEQSRVIHSSDSVSLRLGLLDCSSGAIAPTFTTMNLTPAQRERMEQDAQEEAQSDSDDSDAQIDDDDDVDHDIDDGYNQAPGDVAHYHQQYTSFDPRFGDDYSEDHDADAIVADGDDEMDMEPGLASGGGDSDGRSNSSEGQHDDDAPDDEHFDANSAQSYSDEGGRSEEDDIGEDDSSDLEDTQPSSSAAAAAAAAAVTAASSAPRPLAPIRSPATSQSVVQSGPSGRGLQRMEVHFQLLDQPLR